MTVIVRTNRQRSDTQGVYLRRIVTAMSGRELWADGRLRAAWARRDWATVFRRYRALAGISQMRLGELVGMPQSHVSLIERGRRHITSAEVITRIAEGLQVPKELDGVPGRRVDLDQWAPPLELRERLAHAYVTGRVDLRAAEWIARVLVEHRRAEDQVGGRELWPIVRSQLDSVTRLLPDASGPVSDRLLVLAAEHAHWLSWVASAEGRHGAAYAWLDLAHGWATEAGSADLQSWITRVRSHYTLQHGDPVRALRTAETARQAQRHHLSPAAASIATHATSMAAAAVGERDRARRLADEAHTLALQAPDETDRPGWLYWLDPMRALLHRADAAYATRDWATAAQGFAEVLPDMDQYPRDRAYYMARLEDAQRRA